MSCGEKLPTSPPPLFLSCTVILTPKTAPQRTSVSLRIECAAASPPRPPLVSMLESVNVDGGDD